MSCAALELVFILPVFHDASPIERGRRYEE